MGKIIRREFIGNRFIFWLLCFSGIGIPMAILYLLECTVTIEEAIESPNEFIEGLRGHLR